MTLKAIDAMGKHRGGKGGTIINISSMAGLAPAVYYPIYAATKHAIVGFTNSLAVKLTLKNTHTHTHTRSFLKRDILYNYYTIK